MAMKCPRCGSTFRRTPSIWKCFKCGFHTTGRETSKFDAEAREAWADFDSELAMLIEKCEFRVDPEAKR